MRRKPNALVPLEVAILDALIDLQQRGMPEAHGFLIASQLRAIGDERRLTAYGTLYKALDRLAASGAIESRWEEPAIAAGDGRPRRRYHRITLAGEAARAAAEPARRPSAATTRAATTS